MNKAAPVPKQNQGEPVARIDGRLKVTGQASYPADIRTANLTYAVLATSSIAKGKVSRIHLDKAKAVPGVLDILSYGDMDKVGKPKFGNRSSSWIGPLHDKTIFHDGQIIALVVAKAFEAAEKAAALVCADYAEEKPSACFESKGAKCVDAVGKNPSFNEDPKAGVFDTAWENAAVKVDVQHPPSITIPSSCFPPRRSGRTIS